MNDSPYQYSQRISNAHSDHLLEWEWLEEVSGPVVELGLELHPVETERVEEGGQALHQH